MIKTTILWISIVLLLSSCQQNPNTTKKDIDSIETKSTVSPHQKQRNKGEVVIHFWDDFNFQDDSLAVSPEYGEQQFVNFINLFPSTDSESITKAIRLLIDKSAIKTHIRIYFEELLRRYLYDVNSPFYNESYYVLALEELIRSDHIPHTSKIKYNTLLKIANQNKVGSKAADFTFFTNGKKHTLYDLQKEYTILFFYEPTCSSCKESIELLRNNSQFNLALEQKAIMLAVYPDGNKEIWENNNIKLPTSWVNAIDLDQSILKKGLYDLKASPTIYLVDKNKNVILKDTSIDQLLYYFNNL